MKTLRKCFTNNQQWQGPLLEVVLLQAVHSYSKTDKFDQIPCQKNMVNNFVYQKSKLQQHCGLFPEILLVSLRTEWHVTCGWFTQDFDYLVTPEYSPIHASSSPIIWLIKTLPSRLFALNLTGPWVWNWFELFIYGIYFWDMSTNWKFHYCIHLIKNWFWF